MFKNKTLLITGGSGSFGNAVLERFLDTDIGEIRVFSRDELKQDEMRHKYRNDKIKYYIGDVRDYNSVLSAMHGADFVFAAAALKQVPSCEFYPMQAVQTNIIGMENTLNAAVASNVKKVICLSTDKAVYPVNAMGMSKALMEKVMIAKSYTQLAKDKTVMCGTRYGNVMASRGSVIPLFIDQIKTGKPLTITDPDMTRFMMSLTDSVELVLFAFKHGDQGDIFVQKAPATTILELAETLRDIFDGSNELKIIGTRHGEKKHETLLNREELARAEDMDGFYRVFADARGLNYNMYFVDGETKTNQEDDYTSANTKRLSRTELKDMLLKLNYVQERLNENA